jgi:hypothetical protein
MEAIKQQLSTKQDEELKFKPSINHEFKATTRPKSAIKCESETTYPFKPEINKRS